MGLYHLALFRLLFKCARGRLLNARKLRDLFHTKLPLNKDDKLSDYANFTFNYPRVSAGSAAKKPTDPSESEG